MDNTMKGHAQTAESIRPSSLPNELDQPFLLALFVHRILVLCRIIRQRNVLEGFLVCAWLRTLDGLLVGLLRLVGIM